MRLKLLQDVANDVWRVEEGTDAEFDQVGSNQRFLCLQVADEELLVADVYRERLEVRRSEITRSHCDCGRQLRLNEVIWQDALLQRDAFQVLVFSQVFQEFQSTLHICYRNVFELQGFDSLERDRQVDVLQSARVFVDLGLQLGIRFHVEYEVVHLRK